MGSRNDVVERGGGLIAWPELVAAEVIEPTPTLFPTLWADGDHDDTEALTALLSGLPVRAAITGDVLQAPRQDGWIVLRGGTYLVGDLIRPRAAFMLLNATVRQATYQPETAGLIFDLSEMPSLRPGEATNAIFRACSLQPATLLSPPDMLDS